MQALLADVNVPIESRLALWPLLAETHRSANQSRRQVPSSLQEQIRQHLLEDLVWAHAHTYRTPGRIEELTAARALWNWHSRFEEDATLKAASEELEALYTQ